MKHLSESARKRGFAIHAMVFVPTLVVQAIINLLVGPPWWVLWVLPAWTVGLLAHWWFVLGPGASGTKRSQ